MDKCDKCQNMATVAVTGAIGAHSLCAFHTAELCLSVGDKAGYDKFNSLVRGDYPAERITR